jgi:hypothetical protein
MQRRCIIDLLQFAQKGGEKILRPACEQLRRVLTK